VEDGRAAIRAVEPSVGDALVGRLGEVDAVPAEVRRGAGARGRARHPTPRAVLIVVLAATGPAARLEHRVEPCHRQKKTKRKLHIRREARKSCGQTS
jgi:hypothetical protein